MEVARIFGDVYEKIFRKKWWGYDIIKISVGVRTGKTKIVSCLHSIQGNFLAWISIRPRGRRPTMPLHRFLSPPCWWGFIPASNEPSGCLHTFGDCREGQRPRCSASLISCCLQRGLWFFGVSPDIMQTEHLFVHKTAGPKQKKWQERTTRSRRIWSQQT